jgi:signal transduction histidine kinase
MAHASVDRKVCSRLIDLVNTIDEMGPSKILEFTADHEGTMICGHRSEAQEGQMYSQGPDDTVSQNLGPKLVIDDIHGVHVSQELAAGASNPDSRESAEKQTIHQGAGPRAPKNCIVAEMAPAIAHDFKNNLQAINSALELMQRRLNGHQYNELAPLIDQVLASVARANQLSARLLDCAKPKSPDASCLEVNNTVKSIWPLLCSLLGPAINVALSLSHDLTPVTCDPEALENLLLNLAINARDAMASGGTITIETLSACLLEEGQLRHAEHYTAIFVSDTGVGMSPEVLASAFDPYFTTKPCGRGSGLGLASARAFATCHGGHIDATSEVGKGTTIKLFLPCPLNAEHRPRPAQVGGILVTTRS